MPNRVIGHTIAALALCGAASEHVAATHTSGAQGQQNYFGQGVDVDYFEHDSTLRGDARKTRLVRVFKSPYRAIVFDCDGVLVDSEENKFKAWQQVLTAYGYDLTVEQYKSMVGFDNYYMLGVVRKQASHLSIPDSIIADKEAVFEKLASEHVVAIEANVAFLKRLAATKEMLGIKIGLASSACRSQIHRNIDALGLTNVFDAVISGEDDLNHIADPVRNKPKPYIYQEIARMLGIDSCDILVFEDSSAGITAAHLAGMITCALPNTWTQHQDFREASFKRESLAGCEVQPLLRAFSLQH